jgi:hypothetical protein
LSLDFSLWFPYTSPETILAQVARSNSESNNNASSNNDNSNNSNNNSDNSDLFLSSDIVAGVLESLLEMLCTETDMHVMDTVDRDVCFLHDYATRRQRQRHLDERDLQQSQRLPTILQQDPVVTIHQQHLETLLPEFGGNNNNNSDAQKLIPNKEYYEWTVQYSLVQLGDTYLQQAATTTNNYNDIDNNIDNMSDLQQLQPQVQELAMRTMEQSIQLALDLSIMEGDLDVLLAKHMPPAAATGAGAAATTTSIAIYSSRTGRENVVFGRLAVDLLLAAMSSPSDPSSSSASGQGDENMDGLSRYSTEMWNPMRTSGLALLGSVLFLCSTLGLLAGRRRKLIRTLEQANNANTDILTKTRAAETASLTLDAEDATTKFMLQSREGVDSFLNQSTSFRIGSNSRLLDDSRDMAADRGDS